MLSFSFLNSGISISFPVGGVAFRVDISSLTAKHRIHYCLSWIAGLWQVLYFVFFPFIIASEGERRKRRKTKTTTSNLFKSCCENRSRRVQNRRSVDKWNKRRTEVVEINR